jgi:hypothetical protein
MKKVKFAIIAVRVISLDLKSSLGFKVLETIYCLKTKYGKYMHYFLMGK